MPIGQAKDEETEGAQYSGARCLGVGSPEAFIVSEVLRFIVRDLIPMVHAQESSRTVAGP